MPPVAVEAAVPAVELRQITKRFGANLANDRIELSVAQGSIHGVIGENGAGKSTLMNVLYGLYEADEGTILVDGRPVRIRTPQDAIQAGIGMVHQHFMLVETLTVLENLLLGAEGGVTLGAGSDRAARVVADLERDYGLEVDLEALVGDLPVGVQQRVEILKALFRGARVLILDEPTGVLTPQEADHLFAILRNLKAQGRSVLFITHKLREVLAVTDRVSVMRGGRMVAHRDTAGATRDDLAELMVGRKVVLRVSKTPASPGRVLLEAHGLEVADADGRPRLRGVSLDVRAGEIVGVAGVAGNGQSELLEVLSGMRRPERGSVTIEGRPIHGARDARDAGIAHVPEDRLRQGLVGGLDAGENGILGYQGVPAYGRGFFLSKASVRATVRAWIERYDVRPRAADLPATAFSGGNQQKLVMAREIEHGPLVLLVGQPTRGVDIGAIEFIHRRLVALRDAGKGVLLVSVELDEILALADRILVMADGRVTGDLPAAEATERRLGLLMAGLTAEAA